jgi:hypothetical protein
MGMANREGRVHPAKMANTRSQIILGYPPDEVEE